MDANALDTLAGALRGRLVRPDDADYDEARSLYNGAIDKRPAAIARCVDAADVITCVNLARDQGIDLAVRCGGHNGGGLGSVDGGLVIDLSPIRNVRVDPEARTADVGGGALIQDVDHATGAFGLALPAGIISTTGIGGLTLGGGIGNMTRTFGLTIDHLLGADVVLADGSLVRASESENSDLFWALRGGGGNFGVVTGFRFRLEQAPSVVFGPTLWHLDDAEAVLRWYRDFIVQAPEAVNGFFAYLTVPPVAPFPEELQLQKMAGIVWCCVGDMEQAEAALKPALGVGTPALHGVMPVPVPAMNSAFDALLPKGTQQYWRADFFDEVSDEAVRLNVEHGPRMPTPQTTTHLYPVDGAAARVGADDTAWAYRDAHWAQVFFGVDPDPARLGDLRQWSVDYQEALHPHSMGGAYVNFMMEEGQERVQATYRGHYERLAAIKAHYDPGNVFHVNQNIRPASG